MARDRANINTNIWTDTHWRQLTRDQQWMYELILTHPELSYAGVADWRPGRLMQFSAGTSRQDVERIGNELQVERFVFIDEDTEEVMIRSFLRHDGLLKNPKITVSMVNAYGAIASNKIREVFIHELRRLHDESPELKAFENGKVLALLKNPARPMQEFTQGFTPSILDDLPQGLGEALPQGLPQSLGSGYPLPTTTATTTSTSKDVEGLTRDPENATGQTGTRIPNNFTTNPYMIAWALDNAPNVDLKLSTQKFKAHYRSVAGRAQFRTDWQAAWESWILSDQQRAAERPQQFKTAGEQNLEAGARRHQRLLAEQQNTQQEIES